MSMATLQNWKKRNLEAKNYYLFGLAWVGKHIVFRFITGYIGAYGIVALGNNNRSIFIWVFLKYDIMVFVETRD